MQRHFAPFQSSGLSAALAAALLVRDPISDPNGTHDKHSPDVACRPYNASMLLQTMDVKVKDEVVFFSDDHAQGSHGLPSLVLCSSLPPPAPAPRRLIHAVYRILTDPQATQLVLRST